MVIRHYVNEMGLDVRGVEGEGVKGSEGVER